MDQIEPLECAVDVPVMRMREFFYLPYTSISFLYIPRDVPKTVILNFSAALVPRLEVR